MKIVKRKLTDNDAEVLINGKKMIVSRSSLISFAGGKEVAVASWHGITCPQVLSLVRRVDVRRPI
jgi:hypothetical protein